MAAAATGKTTTAKAPISGAKSCVVITGKDSHKILPYQTTVDTYDAAYNILNISNKFNDTTEKDSPPKPTRELLQYMHTCFKNAIDALQSNDELKQKAITILENIKTIINIVVPAAAAPTAAASAPTAAASAPAAAPQVDKTFLENASEILHKIALELAKPAVNLPKNINASAAKSLPPPPPLSADEADEAEAAKRAASLEGKKGGRRKRNTRHKHKKNKNKTRVGHR
jgi:hypothetical protein